MFFEKEEECRNRHNRGYPIRDRLSIKRTFGSEKDRKKNSKEHIIPFSEHGEEQCSSGKPKCCKSIHKYILEAEGNNQHCKYTDSPCGERDQRRFICKDPDKIPRNDPGEHKHHGCKAKTQQQNIFFRFFHSIHSLGTVIVAEYGLCSAGYSQHGPVISIM